MTRRKTNAVRVGNIFIGGDNPVVIQSMTTTPTLDVAASAAQAAALAKAGAQLVRLTAQGKAHAAALADIKAALRSQGIDTPLSADIHFNAAAAFEAAKHVEKVRINPGNFADPGRTFRKMDFTDAEYAAELQRLADQFVPFLETCRAYGTAIRIGVNHGSLSDRIMSRYGDGTAGMVESALEYLRICKQQGFDDVVISIKASDVRTMTQTVRALVVAMDAEDMHYPLHLGVTEAGNALEGRIKSAVGIGSLLKDGIGDTIRVSLSEDPCAEIPVARAIIAHCNGEREGLDPIVSAAIETGYKLLNGTLAKEDVRLDLEGYSREQNDEIARTIIQASGLARYKAEIVACPGCGRTLFDLPTALERVKEACSHLSHLKIAVMGCIVNGPGEMAGADYGYVGAAAGNVSIYRGIEPVHRNIPQELAIGKLIDLIKADGQWIQP